MTDSKSPKIKLFWLGIIFFLIIGLMLSFLLNVIFIQDKKIKANEKFIQAASRQASSSQASVNFITNHVKELQARLKELQNKQSEELQDKHPEAEEEAPRLRRDAETALRLKVEAQEKAAGLEKNNSALQKEVSELKSLLAKKIDPEALPQALPPPAPVKVVEVKPQERFPESARQLQVDKLKKENERINAHNEQLKSDKKKLQDINARLEKINTQLEAKAKAFFLQVKDIEQAKEQIRQLSGVLNTFTTERSALLKDIEQKKAEIARLMRENTALYATAGDALMRVGLTDEAVEAYNNVLRLDPRNAQAHYKLGFLYRRSMNNNNRAAYHFKKYLSLEPKAKNRKEVEYLIQMLSQYEWDNMP